VRRWLAIAAVAAAGCGRSAPLDAEMRARDAFVRRVAERDGLVESWALMSRSTLVFDDGFAPIEMIDPENPTVAWSRTPTARASGLAQPIRWMGPRAHLRVRVEADMQLVLRGRADVVALFTRPLMTASFDGVEFHAAPVGDDGGFEIRAVLPRARLDGWHDIYVTASTVGEPWRDLTTLHVLRLESAVWEPAGGGAPP
jgi:hypothetical protein